MNKKKLLALLMALVMTFSLVPVTALAEGEAVTDPVARVVRGTTVISSHNTLNEAVASANEAATESDWTVVSNGTAVADQLRIDVYKDISLNQNLESKVRLEVPKGYNVTFDLCGYQFVSTYGAYSIANYGNLTITDSSNSEEYGTGTGAIYNTNKQTGRFYSRDAVRNYGTITINGGNFGDADTDRDNANNNQWGFALRNHGIATINGGYFTACDNSQDSGNVYSYAISNQSNAEMTINYATVYGKMNGGVSADGGAITINDGNYCVYEGNDTYYVLARSYGNFVINGGSFQKFGSGDFGRKLLGGFDGLPSWDESETQNGFTVTGGSFVINAGTDSANTLNITPTTHVAQIGSAKYETLEEAFGDANDVDTITLLRDVVLSDSIDVDKGLVILDLAGHTISADVEKVSGNKFTDNSAHDYLIGIKYGGNLWVDDSVGGGAIDASNLLVALKLTTKGETVNDDEDVSADLTVGDEDADNNFTITGGVYGISGNGTRHQTSLEVYGGTIVGENGTGIYHPQDGYMFIGGGTIVGADAAVEIRSGYDITLWGGTFQVTGDNPYQVEANGSGTTTKGAAIAIAQHTTEKGISVTIVDGNDESGNSFDFVLPNGAVALSVADPEGVGFDNVEFTLTENPNDLFDGNYELEDGYHWYEVSGDESGVYSLMESAAEILDANNDHVNYYQSFSTAVSNAQPGQTVKLLADVALTATVNIDKNLTIDLNGNDIASTDARALWVKSGDVTITGSGTISANGNSMDTSSSVIRVGDSAANAAAASLTVGENVTVSSTRCYGITAFGINDMDNDKTTADITLTVNGTVSVTGSQAAISGNGTSTLSATTMTIGANAVVTATGDYAIYHPGKGTLTVNGTVNGLGGIEMKGGRAIINSGASVTATASEQTHTPYNNGASTSGYAIAAVSNPNYAGDPAVTIEDNATISGKAVILADFNAENVGFVTAKSSDIPTDPDYKWVETETAGVYKLVKKDYVAQIGDNKFTSIQAAINAVSTSNPTEVELLADVATSGTANGYIVVYGNRNITLDLNGHTFSNTAGSNNGYAAAIFDGTLTVKDSGEGGKIKAAADTEGTSVIFITDGGTFTLESGTIDATDGYMAIMTSNKDTVETVNVVGGDIVGNNYCVALWKKDALNVSGGSITANGNDSFAICNNGSIGAANPTTMNISGGTITGGYGIYHAGPGTLNITDGSIVGRTKSGVEMRAGSLNMTGGSVESQSETNPATSVSNGNGSTTDGAAIAVSQHTTKLPVFVGVSGGTVTGNAAVFVTNPEGNAATDGNVSLYLSGGTFDGDILVIDERVVSFIDGGLYTVDLRDSKYREYIISPKIGVEADTEGYYTVAFDEAHTHSYNNNPTWSWKISGTTWSATAFFACDNCDHVEPVTATVTSVESDTGTSTTTTYSAVATFNGHDYPNSKIVTVENTYTVTIGAGSIGVNVADSFRYGEIATLTADGKADWKIDGVTVASGTNTYRFVVTKNVTVTATASEQESTQPVLYATLKQSGQGKTVLQAGWNLPEGYSIISATTYRGTSKSSSPVAEATILAKGAQTTLNLTAREATYTGTYTVSANSYGKYQNVALIVVYEDGNGERHTWSSGVLNMQIPSSDN